MLKDLLRYKVSAVSVGGVLLVLFLVFLGVAYAINRSYTLTFWDKGYELKADFVDADGIANASDIRIAGTYVGQVTQIRSVSGGLAEVTFRVDAAHSPVAKGTRANLRLQTLLGTKYIELVPGPAGGERIAANSVIPASSTQSPVDFDQLLSSFDQPTRDSVSTLIKEGGTAVDGRGNDINGLLQDLHSLSVQSNPDLETFADRKANVDHIVVGLDTVSVTLADNRAHLAGVQAHLDAVLATIAANDPAFRKFIHYGNVDLGHGITQFTGEEQNFNQTIHLLRVDLDQLNPALVDITAVDRAFDPFIKIAGQIVPDLLSAVGGYNANKLNTTCGVPAGCGGFYLRQPSVLANTAVDTEKSTGASAASARSSGTTRRSPVAPVTVPTPGQALEPLLPSDAPAALGIPGLTAPLGLPTVLGPATTSDSTAGGAEIALIDYLLGG